MAVRFGLSPLLSERAWEPFVARCPVDHSWSIPPRSAESFAQALEAMAVDRPTVDSSPSLLPWLALLGVCHLDWSMQIPHQVFPKHDWGSQRRPWWRDFSTSLDSYAWKQHQTPAQRRVSWRWRPWRSDSWEKKNQPVLLLQSQARRDSHTVIERAGRCSPRAVVSILHPDPSRSIFSRVPWSCCRSYPFSLCGHTPVVS